MAETKKPGMFRRLAHRLIVRPLKGNAEAPWFSHWRTTESRSDYQVVFRNSILFGRFKVLRWTTIESDFE